MRLLPRTVESSLRSRSASCFGVTMCLRRRHASPAKLARAPPDCPNVWAATDIEVKEITRGKTHRQSDRQNAARGRSCDQIEILSDGPVEILFQRRKKDAGCVPMMPPPSIERIRRIGGSIEEELQPASCRLALRRIGIVPVGILVANPTVRPMNDDFALLVDRDLPCSPFGISLGSYGSRLPSHSFRHARPIRHRAERHATLCLPCSQLLIPRPDLQIVISSYTLCHSLSRRNSPAGLSTI